MTQWFISNRETIVNNVKSSIPPPVPVEILPIKVEAWEQVLDADGAPVGEPVMKSSQSYPAGSPIKILHFKTLAK